MSPLKHSYHKIRLSLKAFFFKAAVDGVRERGQTQGATLGDEQPGCCNRRTGGGSSCQPRQDMLDRLSLLLCSRELLGHVTGCIAEEASLGHRNLKEPNFVGCPYVNQTQPEVTLLDHKCGHRMTQRLCHNLRRSWREVRSGTDLFLSRSSGSPSDAAIDIRSSGGVSSILLVRSMHVSLAAQLVAECKKSDGPLRVCHHCNSQTTRATAWSRPCLSAARTRTRSRRRQQSSAPLSR